MKKVLIAFIVVAAMLATGCKKTGSNGSEPVLENGADTLSWVMGENIGRSVVDGLPFPLDKEVFVQAILHTIDGKPQPINDTVYEEIIGVIMQSTIMMKQKQADDIKSQADSQQETYFAQLEANNPNVKKHPSGFYYEVLTPGSGPNAKYAQRIRFDYRSFLLSGEAFDQTYGKREPIVHVVGQPMFPGLIEGFQLMNAGSKYRFYFPYQALAGSRTSGSVQAYTPMIYEIELHEIYNN